MLSVSDQVKTVLQQEKISLPELEHIIRQSAIYRVEPFTRRYFDWAFAYDKATHTATLMRKVQRPGHKGTGMRPEERPCSNCGGKGCKQCGYYGTELHLT